MNSAELLQAHDRCPRSAYLSQRWQRHIMNPMNALYRAIEVGLQSNESDPGRHAGDHLMGLAVDRGFDVPVQDVFGHANHLASLADFITWLLVKEPWARPADTKAGSVVWESSSFLNTTGTRLRQVVLVDHWSKEREQTEIHSWRTAGEASVYGMPLDLLICVLGPNREGRRHGPFTRGWLHPVSRMIRHQKRDGGEFDGNWERVFREDYTGSRQDWLDSMTEDGVLTDALMVREILPQTLPAKVAAGKLVKIEKAPLPEPNLSACDGIAPCGYRSECWQERLPSERTGFDVVPE